MEARELAEQRRQTIAVAAIELVEGIRRLFPDAVIKASEPFEDEDICVTVYGPWDNEALETVRQQIYELEFQAYQRHGVEAIVKALPLSYLPE
jgi:hypothetical protein